MESTAQSRDYDIAIIGGGMVGASLALLIAAQQPDWRIALFEAQSFAETDNKQFSASFDARSTALSRGSVEILRELQLWEQLSQHATPIKKVHVSDAGHFMGGLIDAETYALEAVGFVIANAWLGQVLLERMRQKTNIDYLAPVKVSAIIPQKKGALLSVIHGNEIIGINCRLAVVADGGDSPLRSALGIESHIKHYHQAAIIANVAYSEAHNGIAYERFTAQGPLALLPTGESLHARESALVLTLPAEQADVIFHLSDADFLQHLQQRFGYRLGKFERVSQRYVYPLQLVTANEQIRSHIALIGNAAHFLHPVAGQGFNLSLRDCACLVNTLGEDKVAGKMLGELSTLQKYAQRQQLDQALTIKFSDKLVGLFSSSSLPLMALRHLGFLGLDLLPAVKTQFAAQTMGTAGTAFFNH